MTTNDGLAAPPPAGDRFACCIDRVLAYEGASVDDPRDPGGKTRFGISQRTYPTLDIGKLTRADAITLYRRDVWTPLQGDALPHALAFQLLDAAVQHGVARSVRWLQKALGIVADGRLGPQTLAAIAHREEATLIYRFLAIRMDYYADLDRFDVFGRGWTRRMAGNLAYAARDLA